MLFELSVAFASLSAMAGFALALIGWEIFRGSPFGRSMAGLAAILLVLSLYHAGLLLVGHTAVPFFESAAFTALLVWVLYTIHLHRRLARREVGR